MDDYNLVRLNDENFKDLLPIYKSAFGVDPKIDELRKKFNTSNFVDKNIGFIAYGINNEPAAFYGVFPCFMKINGKKILVCQSGDTMTHQNHRRKGLFIKLAKKTYELCENLGIKLVFGFPNENSYPGFVKKLNWKHENNIQCYRINCIGLLLKLKYFITGSELKFSPTQAETYLNKLNVGFRTYSSLCDSSTNNLICRDLKFHNYKQYSKKYLIQLNGKLIYLKPSKDYLHIADIENCNFKDLKKIIFELKKIANQLNIPYLRFNLSNGSKFEIFIKKLGEKMNVSYPIGYTCFGENYNLKNVHFSILDYDTF